MKWNPERFILDSGYINMGEVLRLPYPFIFVGGGRGTGKTYGAILEILENDIRHIFLRRTQSQFEIVSTKGFFPYDTVCQDKGIELNVEKITKYSARVVRDEDTIGMMAALSTFANIRGFDGSWVDMILYDEWIPEAHQMKIKEEGAALLNLYETVNRNRELKGNPPVKLVCLSNSTSIAPPLFLEWGIVENIQKLSEKTKTVGLWASEERGIAVILINDIYISELKGETALYKADAGGRFSAHSLHNSFIYDDFENVVSKNLKNYYPLVRIGDIQIYADKSDKRNTYASRHISGSCKSYPLNSRGVKQFRSDFAHLRISYIYGRMEFETYSIKKVLTETIF